MAGTVAVISKQPHKWHGKVRRKGERLLVTEREAKWLQAVGRAVLEVEHAPAPAPAPEPAPEVTRPKRSYKRKDVAAAPEAPVLTPDEPADYLGNRFTWPTGPASLDDDEPGA